MINYDLNLSDLEKRMSTIYSWEEWHLFENEFFDEAEWSEKSIDVIDKESEIKPISYNGEQKDCGCSPFESYISFIWLFLFRQRSHK